LGGAPPGGGGCPTNRVGGAPRGAPPPDEFPLGVATPTGVAFATGATMSGGVSVSMTNGTP